MLQYLLSISWKYLLVAALAAGLTYWLIPEKLKIEEKIVTEVQERVIVRTRILERPDGTTETIIDERRESDTRIESEKLTTPVADWSVGLSASISEEYRDETVYTLSLQKKLLGGLSGGLYARTDKEIGAVLSYSF